MRAKGLEATGGLEMLALQCLSSVAATFIVQQQGQTLGAQIIAGVLITLVTAFLTAPAARYRGRRIVLVALLVGLWNALQGEGEEATSRTSTPPPPPSPPSSSPPPPPPAPWVPTNWAVVVLAATVGFAGGTGITAAKGDLPPKPHNHVERVRVPVLHKQAQGAAEKALVGEGFKVSVKRTHSETVAEGRVVRTKPAAGSKPETGTPIILIVSTGRFEVLIPTVVGWSKDEAAAKLGERGLRVGTDSRHSETVPPGKVIATDPPGGERVDKGALVTMTVSRGRRETTVPALTGREEREALSLLRDHSLEPRTELVETTSSPRETVLYTEPPGGERVVRGSTVTVYVATHEDKECENFTTQEEAQRYFEELGGPAEDPDELDGDEDGIACE